ncbi:cellulose binding domain-containing protein [Cellulomonas sp. S1-8]|uniref:cellulose binding domain-containing protein n=1 Tax=Cellulomonas sp. S1-8 TaxID=2904790 RepID=UPI0022448337|nr:cellulose binding domain-containing protein [Cellulomonas sp. S1-8]UZN01984.1 cellulose-binding domain-containing protein [Cellulomonas sp. S1-8]
MSTPLGRRTRRRVVATLTALATLTATAATGLITATGAQAAASCRASYTVTAQWPGAFMANVAVTNTGDPVRSWTLAWTAASGQRVVRAYNGVAAQDGTRVTVAGTRYNSALGTGRTAVVSLSGTWTTANPAPTSITFNGTTCTLGATATPTPPAPTTPAPTTPAPTTPAPTTPAPTTPAPTTPAPTPTTPAPTDPLPPQPPTAPGWGSALPPAGATLSRAYQALQSASASGYQPRAGECSVEVHAHYWTYGPDGTVYPTWHPARDASGCTFGHEHGDDPRTSVLLAQTGWPAFAYTSEVLARSTDATGHRHEDHVGHKVFAADDVAVIQGDTGTAVDAPAGTTIATCDVLLKFHQGTHSPDAFTNNLHELLFNADCTQGTTTSQVRYSAMIALGRPGGFGSTDCPGPLGRSFTQVGTATPATSPSDTRSLGRLLTDASCIDAIAGGAAFDSFKLHEFWFSDVRLSTPQVTFQLSPLFYVLNPSRYHDATRPSRLARTVDVCYSGVAGAFCDMARRTTQRTGQQVAWDDVASPFRGTIRQMRPGTYSVRTSGPTTLYTDALGANASTTPFAGSIAQHFSGSTSSSLYVRGATRDHGSDPSHAVHAPN